MIHTVEDAEVVKNLMSLFEQVSKVSHPELEIRINSYHCNLLKNCTESSFFESLMYRLDMIVPNVIHEKTTVASKRINDESEIRCITSNLHDAPVYILKHKPAAHTFQFDAVTSIRASFKPDQVDQVSVVPVKVALSNETPSNEQDFSKLTVDEVVRQRERKSYIFDKFQIDMTEVLLNNVKSQHVEMEFINPQTYDTGRLYHTFLHAMSIVYPNLRNLYTTTEYEKYSSIFVSRGKAPINIQAKHIVQGLQDFWLTNKLDGVAYSLFLHQTTSDPYLITILLKNFTNCWILGKVSLHKRAHLMDLLKFVKHQVRVEVIELDKPNLDGITVQLHLFDIVSSSDPFSHRLNILDDYIKVLSSTLTKPFHVTLKTFGRLQDVSTDVRKIVQDYEKFAKDNDGLIFQPQSNLAAPLKWKLPNKISIDFLFVKDTQKSSSECTYYLLKTLNPKEHSHQLFPIIKPKMPITTTLLPRHTVEDLLDMSDVLQHPKRMKILHSKIVKNLGFYKNLHGLIIECTGYLREIKLVNGKVDHELDFKIGKVRWDKTEPNSTRVALETCIDIVYRREIENLVDEIRVARRSLQPSSVTFHRDDLKQYFFNTDIIYNLGLPPNLDDYASLDENLEIQQHILKFAPNLTCLYDLAAGCGTFASVWHFQQLSVVCFEPRLYNLLQSNLTQYRFTARAKYICIQSDNHSVIPSCLSAMKRLPPPTVAYYDSCISGIYPTPASYFETFPVVFVRSKSPLTLPQKHIHACITLRSGRRLTIVSRVSMEKLRNVNNDLKSSLINKWCPCRTTLDLGSGKGGDLHKYSAAQPSQLVLVEPNQVNITELNQRLSSVNVKASVLRKNAEDIELGQTFDVISVFFMLTFMFRSQLLLDTFIEKLDRHLKPHGALIGTTVVGCRIRELLKQREQLNFVDCMLSRTSFNDSPFGNEIVIDLFGTQTATKQSEWLVDFHTFAQKLAARNIFLSELHYVKLEAQQGEALLADSTLGFVFHKNNCAALYYQPCPLGRLDAWRVPVPYGPDNLFYCIAMSSVNDDALHRMLSMNLPYQLVDVQAGLQELVQQLKDAFVVSPSLYLCSHASKRDLVNVLRDHTPISAKLSEQLRLFLNNDIVRSAQQVATMISQDVFEEFYGILEACFKRGSWSQQSFLDLLCSFFRMNLFVFDVATRSPWYSVRVLDTASFLCLARIDDDHFELLRSSSGDANSFVLV